MTDEELCGWLRKQTGPRWAMRVAAARIEELNRALAVARRDALLEAAEHYETKLGASPKTARELRRMAEEVAHDE